MSSVLRRIDEAILMTDRGEYLPALTAFLEIYGTEDSPPLNSAKAASGLSYFGLCLALVQKKYKAGAELCKRAMGLEFYNGDHYANLARINMLIGNRKKALETVEAGLKIAPENDALLKVRRELGIRGCVIQSRRGAAEARGRISNAMVLCNLRSFGVCAPQDDTGMRYARYARANFFGSTPKRYLTMIDQLSAAVRSSPFCRKRRPEVVTLSGRMRVGPARRMRCASS